MADKLETTTRTGGLTTRQAQLLAYLSEHIAAHDGISPTFEEMRIGIGASSKSQISHLLSSLEEKGRITRLYNRWRAIQIVPVGVLSTVSTEALIAELESRGADRWAA
jgi:repressor LexA